MVIHRCNECGQVALYIEKGWEDELWGGEPDSYWCEAHKHFKPGAAPIHDDGRGMVTISFETAEYLSVLMGQNNWGNQERRGRAAHELGHAMQGRQMTRSLECFQTEKDKRR